MLYALKRALRELPELLADDKEWASLDVTYHPPHVERLWRPYGEGRIMLHCIHPCDEGQALYHPHPWPSAVALVRGHYFMGISSRYDPDDEHEGPAWTSEHATVLIGPDTLYEMLDRNGWHYVRPVNEPAWSVMVTGKPYDPPVEMPNPPTTTQKPLKASRFNELMEEWRWLCQ